MHSDLKSHFWLKVSLVQTCQRIWGKRLIQVLNFTWVCCALRVLLNYTGPNVHLLHQCWNLGTCSVKRIDLVGPSTPKTAAAWPVVSSQLRSLPNQGQLCLCRGFCPIWGCCSTSGLSQEVLPNMGLYPLRRFCPMFDSDHQQTTAQKVDFAQQVASAQNGPSPSHGFCLTWSFYPK